MDADLVVQLAVSARPATPLNAADGIIKNIDRWTMLSLISTRRKSADLLDSYEAPFTA